MTTPTCSREQAEHLADAYFSAMRDQSLDGLLALLGDDAMIVWPDGRAIEGKENIAAAYARIFSGPSNNPDRGDIMMGSNSFSAEVVSRFASGETRRTINVFRLGSDGRFARMDSYRQG